MAVSGESCCHLPLPTARLELWRWFGGKVQGNRQTDRPGDRSHMIEPLQIPARGLVFDALAAGPPAGEPVMLLHGFPQTSACWTPLLETLAVAGYRAATPFSLRAPRVGVPTLYVWGSGDPALGPRAASTTGRWVGGAYRFEVLPGAGHWLPEHHAEELGRLLLEHLRRWDARPANTGGRAR
jgi:pimeloyl-ACP methyl ester carboxylesterase